MDYVVVRDEGFEPPPHAPKAWTLPGYASPGNLVPDVGIELTTYRLQGGCSTTELIRLNLAPRRGLEPRTQ